MRWTSWSANPMFLASSIGSNQNFVCASEKSADIPLGSQTPGEHGVLQNATLEIPRFCASDMRNAEGAEDAEKGRPPELCVLSALCVSIPPWHGVRMITIGCRENLSGEGGASGVRAADFCDAHTGRGVIVWEHGTDGPMGPSYDTNTIRLTPDARRLIRSLNPQPSTLNPQPSTLNPQPSTLNPQPSAIPPYAINSSTTFPITSVNRKSLPAYRYVSFS